MTKNDDIPENPKTRKAIKMEDDVLLNPCENDLYRGKDGTERLIVAVIYEKRTRDIRFICWRFYGRRQVRKHAWPVWREWASKATLISPGAL